VMIVSVDSDEIENQKFCKGYNKVGRYKHPISSETVKFIGFALPYDPEIIVTMNIGQFVNIFCTDLLSRLSAPSFKIPSTFNYEKFCFDLREPLEILKRAFEK